MTGIELTPSQLDLVLSVLDAHFPHHEVWVFGSRARHTAKPFSDLDLALVGDEQLPLSALARLSEAFSGSDLPFKVDLVDWATTSEAFRNIILSEKITLCRT